MFQGKRCAASLPMSMLDLRCFQVPRADIEETRLMVAEELSAELGAEPQELAFDFWETQPSVSEGLVGITALAMPQVIAQGVGDGLSSAGLECQVLDAPQCALARAVKQVSSDGEPAAALDFGCTAPSLVVVQNGHPVYSRVLRSGGLAAIHRDIKELLHVSDDDCRMLLSRFGASTRASRYEAAAVTMQWIGRHLDVLVSEIERTLDFAAVQLRLQIRKMWLFGGGALVNNVPEYLNDKLPLTVQRYCLSQSGAEHDEALYGLAAGLSLLRWEM
jgi:Tfp pilus assembly PilM family ATPase